MPGQELPDLSLIILSWNTRALLLECLQAVMASRGALKLELVVIDNASGDGSPEMVACEFPEARLVKNSTNLGYAQGVNQGLRLARGRFLCLLGSDTRVDPDALAKLVSFLETHPEVGAVAPRLVHPDGRIQRACMRFPTLKTALFWDTPLGAWFPGCRELERYQMQDFDHTQTRLVEQPPGTCFMLSRRTFERLGPMDPRLYLFFNDVDWALRLRRLGLPIWYLAEARVVHHLGGSTRSYADFGAEWHRNRVAFYQKHFHQAGAWLTKLVATYVSLRQMVRVKKTLPLGREYFQNAAAILRAWWSVLTL